MVKGKKKQENQVSLVHTLHRILAFQTANSTHPASHNEEYWARQRDLLNGLHYPTLTIPLSTQNWTLCTILVKLVL